MLASILLKYDLKTQDGIRPANRVFQLRSLPDIRDSILFRKRRLELRSRILYNKPNIVVLRTSFRDIALLFHVSVLVSHFGRGPCTNLIIFCHAPYLSFLRIKQAIKDHESKRR